MSTVTELPRKRARLPEWFRLQLPTAGEYFATRNLIDDLNLHTVCESARCPNHWECWSKGTATFMIAGDRCTRACGFCAVDTRKPMLLESDEPERVAEAARRMQLKHMVITAVARDDLVDGGAAHFQKVIKRVREVTPEVLIEALTPDFRDEAGPINTVIAARPDIFNHNIETVRSLTSKVRSVATYERSLSVLSKVKKRAPEIYTKSGLMLGLGETKEELLEAMTDLRSVGCDLLTLGQYLQPTKKHLKIAEFIHPDQFTEYKRIAEAMGFSHVASGPLVRSSYHADDFVPEEFASRS